MYLVMIYQQLHGEVDDISLSISTVSHPIFHPFAYLKCFTQTTDTYAARQSHSQTNKNLRLNMDILEHNVAKIQGDVMS